ncbi:MAG: amidohydrolase [Candidatus Omnitrophica bacterium]|nr:amidohydrolase [Candidatus Omnitrophota bacterium]
MIIDVHTHIFPDELALKAVPKMAKEAGIQEAIDGRCASLLQSMDEAGIDKSWLQPVATKPVQVQSINTFVENLRSERLVSFGAVHPDCDDLSKLADDLAERGFPGVKIHPEYHQCRPDDPRFTPLYEALQANRMIVLFHAGYDIGIPTINSAPIDFARLKDKYPRLTLILAHMGGFQQWEEVSKDLAGEDVYLDTSYSLGHFPDEDFVALVRKHGVHRILFGTDSPWADQKKDVDYLKSLSFSDDELKSILGENAQSLLENQHKNTT